MFDATAQSPDAPAIVSGAWCAPSTLGDDGLQRALVRVAPSGVRRAATPTEDLSRAELRWVRWSERGLASLSTRQGERHLSRRPDGPPAPGRAAFTVVWFPALREADGGLEAHAIDAEARGFTGDERPATAAESSAAAWASAPMPPLGADQACRSSRPPPRSATSA